MERRRVVRWLWAGALVVALCGIVGVTLVWVGYESLRPEDRYKSVPDSCQALSPPPARWVGHPMPRTVARRGADAAAGCQWQGAATLILELRVWRETRLLSGAYRANRAHDKRLNRNSPTKRYLVHNGEAQVPIDCMRGGAGSTGATFAFTCTTRVDNLVLTIQINTGVPWDAAPEAEARVTGDRDGPFQSLLGPILSRYCYGTDCF